MGKMTNYAYAFLTVFIWGTNTTVIKLVLSDIPNLEALSVTAAMAFMFMLAINIVTGKIGKIKEYGFRDILIMCGLGFLGLFVYSVLYYYGISVLSAQEACILNYLWPIMILLFSGIVLKEKLTAKKILAMVCSFAGIVILSCENGAAQSGNRLLGMTACVVGAACYGLFSVLNKKADYDQNIAMMFIWLTTGVFSFVFGYFIEEWIMPEGVQWAGILWLGLIVDALAYLLWALAINGEKSTAGIANIAYMTPLLSVIISALVLKEKLSPSTGTALIFIIGGIFVQGLKANKE